MEYTLVNIEQLPQDDAALNNRIMFGIGAILHSTTLEQIKDLILQEVEQDLPLNAFRIFNVFPHSTFDDDFKNNQLGAVATAINYSITTFYGGVVECDLGQQIVFRLMQQSPFESSSTGDPLLLWRYYILSTGALSVLSVSAGQIVPAGEVREEPPTLVDLGDIGTTVIEDAFNADGDAPFSMSPTVFVKATQNDAERVWGWIGDVGLFGGSETQATSADFILLEIGNLASPTNLQEAYLASLPLPENVSPDSVLSVKEGIVGETPVSAYTLLNQSTQSDTTGDTGENLIQPDFGLPILTVDDMQEGNSYKGILVGKIDNQDAGTNKEMTFNIEGQVQSTSIFNDTLVAGESLYFLNFTLDFLVQSGDDITIKGTIQGDVDGIPVRQVFQTTLDNTEDREIIFTIDGHSTDLVYLEKVRIDR